MIVNLKLQKKLNFFCFFQPRGANFPRKIFYVGLCSPIIWFGPATSACRVLLDKRKFEGDFSLVIEPHYLNFGGWVVSMIFYKLKSILHCPRALVFACLFTYGNQFWKK